MATFMVGKNAANIGPASNTWVEAAVKLGSGWVLAAYLVWQLTAQFAQTQKDTNDNVGRVQASIADHVAEMRLSEQRQTNVLTQILNAVQANCLNLAEGQAQRDACVGAGPR